MALDCGAATQPWGPAERGGRERKRLLLLCFDAQPRLLAARTKCNTIILLLCSESRRLVRARVFVRALLFLFLFLSFSHIVPGRSLEISLTAALSSLIGWCIRQAAVSSSNCSVWGPTSEFMPTYSCALAQIEDQSPVRCVFLLLFL